MDAPQNDIWHCERDGRAVGIFDTPALLARLRQDTATWRVWKPGMSGWQPVEKIFDEDARWGPPLSSPTPSDTNVPVTPTSIPADKAKRANGSNLRQRRGYLLRHWRGELGLGVSYWVNCALLSIILSLLSFGVGYGIGALRVAPITLAVAISVIALFGVGITLWQNVGTWRSASHHATRGGKRIWSIAAKILVVVGLVQSLFILVTQGIPTAFNAWVWAAMFAGPPPTAIALRRGTEVAFVGTIRPGAAAILQHALNAAPGARVLHLESSGGDLNEAAVMAAAVRQRGITTYVRGQCFSACTLVFRAGQTRILRHGATLGFHRPWTISVDSGVIRRVIESERARMAHARLPAWFIDRVMATSPSAIWLPSDTELTEVGILSNRVDGEDYSPGQPRATVKAEEMADILRGLPMAAALERRDPTAFKSLQRKAMELAYDGGTRGEMIDAVHRAALPIYATGLRIAPDAELIAVAQAALPAAETLARRDPSRCQDWLLAKPSRPLPNVTRLLGSEEITALETAAAAVMDVTADPTVWIAAPNAEKAREPLQAVYEALAVRLDLSQATALGDSGKSMDGAARACWTMIRSLQEILRLPSTEAALALRHVLSRNWSRLP